MVYKEELTKQINDLHVKANRMQQWLDSLTQDGFDWDNVTEPQRYAIENLMCAHGDYF